MLMRSILTLQSYLTLLHPDTLTSIPVAEKTIDSIEEMVNKTSVDVEICKIKVGTGNCQC